MVTEAYDAVHEIDAVDYHNDQANDPPGPAYLLGRERDPSIYLYISKYIKRDPVSSYKDPVLVMVEPISLTTFFISFSLAQFGFSFLGESYAPIQFVLIPANPYQADHTHRSFPQGGKGH